MRVRGWLPVGAVMAVVWLFVRGVELAPDRVVAEGLIGLGVGLTIAYGFRRMYLPTVDVGRAVRVAPTAVSYVSVFLRELLTANVDVAYRVLHPSMPIEPDVVELPLRVETDAAITTIANSITLTPGTLTMDHDPDTNTLYVHGIVGRRRDDVVAPIRAWEDLLLVIFEEDAAPEEAPPARPSARAPHAPEEESETTDADERETTDADGRETTDADGRETTDADGRETTDGEGSEATEDGGVVEEASDAGGDRDGE